MPWETKDEYIWQRIREPGEFKPKGMRTGEDFGWKVLKTDKPRVMAVIGVLKTTGKTAVQALRFPLEDGWTVEKGKKWLAEHPDVKAAEADAALLVFEDVPEGLLDTVSEDFAEIPRLEIFEAGHWRDHDYTSEDIDRMVDNFEPTKVEIEPTLIIGHGEEQELLAKSGLPAAGRVEQVWREGLKLVGRVKDVPRVIAELIGKGAYKRQSAEVYHDYKGRGMTLRRVALLGGDIPEVKTLGDVLALYGDSAETVWVSFEEEGGQVMPELDVLKQQVAEREVKLTEAATKLAEVAAKLAEKDAALTKLNERQKKMDEDRAAAAKRAKIKAIAEFSEKQKEAGKLIPADEDAGLKLFMEELDNTEVVTFSETDDKRNVTPLEWFKLFVERLPKRVDLSEKGGSGAKEQAGGDDDVAKHVERAREFAEKNKCSMTDALSATAEKRE